MAVTGVWLFLSASGAVISETTSPVDTPLKLSINSVDDGLIKSLLLLFI